MIFYDAPVSSFACAQEQDDPYNSNLHSLACTLRSPLTRYQDGYRG
jgi:hypothetical protein